MMRLTVFSVMPRQMMLHIAGLKVTAVRDYLKGIRTENGKEEPTGLPVSDVLYFELEGGCWVCVRPSGTEPKCKFYYCVNGDPLDFASWTSEYKNPIKVKSGDVVHAYVRTTKGYLSTPNSFIVE